MSSHPPSIELCLDFLENHAKYLTEEHLTRLSALAPARIEYIEATTPIPEPPKQEVLGFDSEIDTAELETSGDPMLDLRAQLGEQMKLLQILRQNVAKKASKLSSRDLKDLVNTTNSVFSMLVRLDDTILNQDRARKLEAAVVETVKSLSEDQQAVFFQKFEDNLQNVP